MPIIAYYCLLKSIKMSKKKNVIARVGGFEVIKESGAEHDYIRVKAIGGHWGITHRDDSIMFGLWVEMCKDPGYKRSLELRCSIEYSMSQMLYDEGFIRDWLNAVNAFNQRKAESAPEPTEKEEEDAIAEVEMMQEAKKAIQGGESPDTDEETL